MFFSSFLTIASLHLLAVVSPGPDFVMVMRNAFSFTRKTAFYTSLGIAVGVMFHVSYCILGFAIVIKQSLWLFNTIKTLGALYLLYIGIKALFAKNTDPEEKIEFSQPTKLSNWQAFRQGFLCNVLNPKATIFFLGIFTLVINPKTPILLQSFWGLWMMLVTLAWFSLISIGITNQHLRRRIWRIQPVINKVMGVLLLVFGVNLLIFVH